MPQLSDTFTYMTEKSSQTLQGIQGKIRISPCLSSIHLLPICYNGPHAMILPFYTFSLSALPNSFQYFECMSRPMGILVASLASINRAYTTSIHNWLGLKTAFILCRVGLRLLGKLTGPSQRMPAEALYILQLVGFSAGCTGCLLALVTMTDADWRLWLIKKNSVYSTGIARVGIWQICFPPYVNTSDRSHMLCCHRFPMFEKYLPVEMKLGQILIALASLFAFWGLLFSFATPWNFFYLRFTPTQIWWVFIAGGIFHVLSGICILVPISWNVYSVSVNASIHFPESFHLPSRPIAQRNGSAVFLGYTSGVLLLVGGVCLIILRSLMRPARVTPVQKRIHLLNE